MGEGAGATATTHHALRVGAGLSGWFGLCFFCFFSAGVVWVPGCGGVPMGATGGIWIPAWCMLVGFSVVVGGYYMQGPPPLLLAVV